MQRGGAHTIRAAQKFFFFLAGNTNPRQTSLSPHTEDRMGIQGLSKLIADQAPNAIKENEIKNYFSE